jgi:hypothetical protein
VLRARAKWRGWRSRCPARSAPGAERAHDPGRGGGARASCSLRLASVRHQRRVALHNPDLAVASAAGGVVAVKLELSVKAPVGSDLPRLRLRAASGSRRLTRGPAAVRAVFALATTAAGSWARFGFTEPNCSALKHSVRRRHCSCSSAASPQSTDPRRVGTRRVRCQRRDLSPAVGRRGSRVGHYRARA